MNRREHTGFVGQMVAAFTRRRQMLLAIALQSATLHLSARRAQATESIVFSMKDQHGHGHDLPHRPAEGKGHDRHRHGEAHADSDSHGNAHADSRSHDHGSGSSRGPMAFSLALTVGFALVEAFAGWWSGSLALLSDAGHMLTDGLALGLALFAQSVARKPPSERNTYGYSRAEVLGAFVNAVFMVLVIALIAIEAIQRLFHPTPVAGLTVMWVAAAGLVVNLIVARILHGSHDHDLNSRAAYLHVLGDALGSVAALVAGAIVWKTGWVAADPLLSLFVVALMMVSTWRLLRESTNVLMQGVPVHLSYPGIGQALAEIQGIRNVHDLHVWHLSSKRIALSAHVMIDDPARWPAIMAVVRRVLLERFAIDHVTLQPGWTDARANVDGPAARRVITVAALETKGP